MFRRLHARRHDHRGAAAVEFALVLLPLMLLIFGIIQYGIYFWARQSAVAAAREGARRASVGDYATCATFQPFVKGELKGVRNASAVQVHRTFTNGPNHSTSGGAVQVGDTMKVTVQFDSLSIGLVPLPSGGTITIDTTSRMENINSGSVPATC